MINKVKQWFGIEGVKVKLILPEIAKKSEKKVKGQVQFTSISPQTVLEIRLILVEVYTRGRNKNKKTDEYEIGKTTITESIEVPVEAPTLIDFELPFELLKSEIDEMGDKNLLLNSVAKLAKYSRGVHSSYRIDVEVEVEGTRLNPFDKKVITLK